MSTVSDVTTTTTQTAADQMKKKLGMNKDDFLKLFIAQLQYQDPLAPQDPTAMLNQLSQLTMVEQAYNTSATLDKMLAAQNNSLSMGAVSLIGKQVIADGDQIGFNGAEPATARYQTSSGLSGATLSIKDSSGKLVNSINLGDIPSGSGSYQWDGHDGQGNLLPAGVYTYTVSGTDGVGQQQYAATATSGKVDGASFMNGTAYISMGPVVIPFSDVVTVKES